MIGVIADDLSGAAEIAGIGFRHGLSAEILTLAGKASSEAELVCVDADSRSREEADAVRRMITALRLLESGDLRHLFKKVDSVLRGHVVRELDAVMQERQAQRALLVPANPGKGRVIRGGRYYVNSTPLNETQFGDDPDWPRRSSWVPELIGSSAPRPMAVHDHTEKLPPRGIIIGNAQSMPDLQGWAAAVHPGTLAAGAAEFFEVFLHRIHECSRPRAGREVQPRMRLNAQRLFVCGSTRGFSPALRDNIARGRLTLGRIPEHVAVNGELEEGEGKYMLRAAAAAFEAGTGFVLATPRTRAGSSRIMKALTHQLALVAIRILRHCGVPHLLAEGGATAAEIIGRLGWSRMRVVQEWSPGVVSLQGEPEENLLFTIKPGSYLWPDSLLDHQRDCH